MKVNFLVVLLILVGLTGCGENDQPVFDDTTSMYGGTSDSACYDNDSSMGTADNPMCTIYYLERTDSCTISYSSPEIRGEAAPPIVIGATVVCVLTLVDMIGLGVSVNDFINDPTLENGLWVNAEILAVVTPLPSPTVGKHALKSIAANYGGDINKYFKAFRLGSYKNNLQKFTGVTDEVINKFKLQAHHILSNPKRNNTFYKSLEINRDDPMFLTWWKNADGSHQRLSKEYNKKMDDIVDQVTQMKFPSIQAKREVFFKKVKELADEYSEYYYEGRYHFKLKD